MDLSVSAKQQELYNKQKLDIERWTELGEWGFQGSSKRIVELIVFRPSTGRPIVAEAKALRREMGKIASDYDYDWKGQLEDLEDVEVQVKDKNGAKGNASSNKDPNSKDTVTSVLVKGTDGKKIDVEETIDEAADMERQTRKKEGTRRHGKGGSTEEMDASAAAGEKKAQQVIGQEPISTDSQKRGLHTIRVLRDGLVPLPFLARTSLTRAFSTNTLLRAPAMQVSEQMQKVISHKVDLYKNAVKQVCHG